MKKIPFYTTVLTQAFSGFNAHNVLRLSASLSYYTLFSLAPMLLMITALAGFFLGREAVEGQLYAQLNGLIGNDAAKQVQDIIKNTQQSNQSSGWAAVVGGITLLIGATGTFAEMQDAINLIWGVKAKPTNGIVKYLTTRLLSFSLIVSLGFLLMVSLVANALLDAFSARLSALFSEGTYYLFSALNSLVVFAVITFLFAVIFKVLPDVRLRWRNALVGASFTALLFMLGKYAIGLYLGQSGVSSTYGAAGSVVLVLLWVYYSAIILYFGAEFTRAYTERLNHK